MRGSIGDVKLGIFEAGSHQLVHIPKCPVHHNAIVELCGELATHLNELEIEPYRESSHQGLLRAAQFAVQPASSKVQLGLLLRAERLELLAADTKLVELTQRLAPHLHSLFLGALPRRDNSLFAHHWQRLSGPDMMVDQSGGAQVFYPPDAFGQANPVMHARVVERIHELVGNEKSVVEYYAGVGTIGLGLCTQDRRVVFNEVGSGSLSGLARGLEELGAGRKETNVDVRPGPAGAHVDAYGASDVVILDPPRKGLDVALFEQLRRYPPRRIIYLSCGLPALMREATGLLDTNRYQISHASVWAYFPFTEHIETLMVFDRVGSGG